MAVTDVVRKRRVRIFRDLRLVAPVLHRVKRHLAYGAQRLSRQVVPPDVQPAPVRVKVVAHVVAVFVPQLHHARGQHPRNRRVPFLVHIRIKNPARFQVFANRDVIAHVRVYLETLFVFAHVLRVLVQLTKRVRDQL